MTEPNLRGLQTAVVQRPWGLARVSRAKEVISTVFSKEHRVSRIMHTRHERLLRLACRACRPGVTQVFAQAIRASGGRSPGTEPVKRALRTAASPGWAPQDSWCSDVPGHEHTLHFVQEPLCHLQHQVRDSLRCHLSRQLEARCPVPFGGLSNGADSQGCRAALWTAPQAAKRTAGHHRGAGGKGGGQGHQWPRPQQLFGQPPLGSPPQVRA